MAKAGTTEKKPRAKKARTSKKKAAPAAEDLGGFPRKAAPNARFRTREPHHRAEGTIEERVAAIREAGSRVKVSKPFNFVKEVRGR